MALKLRKQELKQDDRKFLGRTQDPEELQVVSAKGSHVTDGRGRTFIDFQMGWSVGNLGWNHPEICERLRNFEGPFYVSPEALYAPWVELAKLLAEVTPGALTRSFRAVGGTEAVELALQLAMTYTRRTKLVSLTGAYHGNSALAVSVGEAEGRPSPLSGGKKLALPLDAKAIDRLKALLAHRDVAAFIMEPIVLNLAVETPSAEFMTAARALCDRYGTLLIFDEIASGFGRTGMMFGCEHYDLEPDILVVAKAITSGHAPLAAAITTAKIADAVRGKFSFFSTYGWHPLAVEAAIATIEYWRRHMTELLGNIAERSREARSRLSEMAWKREPELRIKGLAIAIKLDDRAYLQSVAERCLESGLLIVHAADHLLAFPALNIDHEMLLEGLAILERAVEASTGEHRRRVRGNSVA